MIYKRKDQKTEVVQEVNKETPVALPRQEALPVESQTFTETVKEVMETHKDTLEKLRDSDFTDSTLGLFKNKETGHWSLVEITYDPLNLTVNPKVVVTNLEDPSRDYARESFLILMDRKLFS